MISNVGLAVSLPVAVILFAILARAMLTQEDPYK